MHRLPGYGRSGNFNKFYSCPFVSRSSASEVGHEPVAAGFADLSETRADSFHPFSGQIRPPHHFRYPVEGVRGRAVFEQERGAWVVADSSVVEE